MGGSELLGPWGQMGGGLGESCGWRRKALGSWTPGSGEGCGVGDSVSDRTELEPSHPLFPSPELDPQDLQEEDVHDIHR